MGQGGVTDFSFEVISTFEADIGKLKISDPYVSFQLLSPFDTAARTVFLGLGFKVEIGSIAPINCFDSLQHSGGQTQGTITAPISGILYIRDIFDFDVADSGTLSLFISAIGLDLEIGGIALRNPAFSLIVNTKKSFSFTWDGMYVEVGGEKKLDLRLFIPVGEYTANLINLSLV